MLDTTLDLSVFNAFAASVSIGYYLLLPET